MHLCLHPLVLLIGGTKWGVGAGTLRPHSPYSSQAKPKCTCLPPSATSTQWEQWFIRKYTVRCWNIWGTLGNKKSQVIFKGRHLHYPIPSSLSKAAPGLWLFINVALLFNRAIDSCWKRCLMATVSFSLVCWARKLPSYTTPQFKISPRQF